MRIYDIQTAFARGELSPRLHARTDIDHYRLGLKECTNFYVLRQGALRKRQGTEFVAEVRDSANKTRLVPFIFSTQQAYMLEFGHEYFRVFVNGSAVVEPPKAIDGATNADPVVLSSPSHGFANGDRVIVSGVAGMTEINEREFVVANVVGTTFELANEDGTGHGTYAGGGQVARIPQFATSYLETELFDLQFAQSADTLYVAHKGYAPRKITRTSDIAWTVSEVDFQNGPFLPQTPGGTATSLTLSADGNVIPQMTSNTAPSGTAAASGGSATAWHAADRTRLTGLLQADNGIGWWEYDAGAPRKVVGYFLQAGGGVNANGTPVDFVFEGFTGSVWVALDAQSNVDPWAESEVRYFPFDNDTFYQKYRLRWTQIGDGSTSIITEIGFKESADEMLAITLTASSTSDINGSAGFQATDFGRPIRIRGSDGVWRWFEITGYTSPTVVTGVLHGQPLPDLEATTKWQLGAFSDQTGYPQSVSFFEERLVWARTDAEPQKVWGSKSFAFEDHGVSAPLVDDDAFAVEIASDQVNEIKWISESSDLLLGTSDAIRTLGPSDSSKAFSATNLRQRRQTTIGSAALQPARIGGVSLYADRFARSLRELFFSFESNAFAAPDLTIMSDHLLASGITAMAYAQMPDSILWVTVGSGELVSLTYERDHRIVGLTRHLLGGGGADDHGIVESVATIPGAEATEVWLLVRRTINGATKRYVERLSPQFENMDIEDAAFLDSHVRKVDPVGQTLTGLGHLEGETIGIVIDGAVAPDQVVSGGAISLPDGPTPSKVVVGLRYRSKAVQLRPPLAGRDGSHLGRLKSAPEILVDLHESLALRAGPEGAEVELIEREAGELMDQQITPRTGTFKVHVQGGWRDVAELSLVSDQPLPATVRAITRGLEIEP